MTSTKQEVISLCNSRIGSPEYLVFAPGRANIIGEHTDYSDGYVMPFATQYGIYLAAKKVPGSSLEIFSITTNQYEKFNTKNLSELKDSSWSRFMKQSILQLNNQSFPMGLSIVIGGDLPIGAGMSSSSALTCGFLALLNEVYHLGYSRKKLMQLAVYAEHGTGVKGGMMDQYTIMFAEKNKALFIDCETLEHRSIPLPTNTHFVLLNTNVKHELVDSPYNTRRAQSETALESIRSLENNKMLQFKHIKSLQKYKPHLDPLLFKRANHIVSENQRVLSMKEALHHENFNLCGRILKESHHSLSVDYDVSCAELDFLVENGFLIEGWQGGRMMGGGFGGCTVNLMQQDVTDKNFESLREKYYAKFLIQPEFHTVLPSASLTVENFS
ncbi:MAG: galactokinase [Saprospiraceae bacterium]